MIIVPKNCFSQETSKKLFPRNINTPYLNQLAPSMSGDGNTMVFLSDEVSSKRLNMQFTYKTGPERWADAERLTVIDNSFELNHLRGYSLSFDGKTLFYTTLKAGGIGGYDIWYVTRTGNTWGQPKNLGKPLNSPAHEGDPSISPDGRFLYFMRCDQMNMNGASGCKIYVSEKKNNVFWGEPVELPAPINTGNDMTPRIMPDDNTLLFGSTRPGGKGGVDVYMSKQSYGIWSDPVPYNFINSEGDDQYISVPARSDLLVFSMKQNDKDKLVMAKIPEEIQPEKVLQVKGKVLDAASGGAIKATIQVFDPVKQELIQLMRTDLRDGSFYMLLKDGAKYDFSVTPADKRYFFASKMFDLTGLERFTAEKEDILLEIPQSGSSVVLNNIIFQPNSIQLSEESTLELKRLFLYLKHNPNSKIEIGAHLGEYLEDSIQSNPDLTEVIIDTIENVLEADSLVLTIGNDSLINKDTTFTVVNDTMMNINEEKLDEGILNNTDSLEEKVYEPKFIYKYTYHNDRSEQEAKAIFDFLIDKGVPADNLSYKSYGLEKPLIPEESVKNKRIEVTFF
ncbi:MAG: hypothetical protein KTR26_16535 [Flammeovirgaceae bacterium]|nr:hypothetical protein [Flammeovirgaceae bacterium]